MLVLSRQRDETIMIGDEIEITVVDIRGDKVRLGITAPTRIAVHRKEVYEAIKAENEQASRVAGSDFDPPPADGISPGPAKLRSNPKASRLATGTPVARPGDGAPQGVTAPAGEVRVAPTRAQALKRT